MQLEPDRLPEHCARIAQAFRLGCDAEGAELLVQLIECLSRELSEPGAGAARDLARIGAALESGLEAQGRGDGIALADVLEHELAPLL